MTTYLIDYDGVTSEHKYNFVQVQEWMNHLEHIGIVSNVTVRQFVNHLMTKGFTYDFNGVEWEKRK